MGKTYFLAKVLISVVIFCSLLAGLHRFLFANDENKCDMTYMYEYPQYIKIPVTEISNSSYGLYVYGEGDLAESYRNGRFRGIPVLFVPGNSGSHRQVRSLASVAYRKFLESRTKYHFDFFTVDFNEELTALYGGYFQGQVAFVKECIRKILSLYSNQKKLPTSVILVGHSMGGMVAKGLFLGPDFDPHYVQTVVTLATPHRFPVVAADPFIVEFYEKVNHFWSSTKPDNVVLASVGGASRDVQVRSGLTSAHDPAINVLTTAVPGAWLSTDHLCLVWCKQVVLALTRALFDLVDPKTLLPSEDTKWRQDVFRYHLISRYSGKHYRQSQLLREVTFDEEGDWREVIASQFLMKHSPESGNVKNTYFMIPLLDKPHKDRLVAIATGLGVRDWIFGCVASSWRGSVRFCTKGINLSDQTVLLPSMSDSVKRKLLHLDLIKVKADGYSHIVFNLPRAEPKASISMDVHRTSDRQTIYPFSPFDYLGTSTVVAKTVAGAISHNVTFPDFTKSWQSFRFSVEPVAGTNCKALVRKVVAWNSAETEFFLAFNRSSAHPADLQLHAPKTLMDGEEKYFSVELIALPGCEYTLSIQFDWIGSWSQIVRFYPTVIVSLVCAILLDCLSRQLLCKSRGQQVPSLLSVLSRMSFWKMFVLPELLGIALGFLDAWKLNLPVADDFALRNEGLGLPLLLFLLGCPAWILSFLVVFVLHAIVVFGGNTLHLFVVRYLGGSLGVGTIAAELVCLGLNKFPFAIAVLLAAVSASTCGAAGLIFGFAVCVWKLFQVYEDQLEDLITEGGEPPESKEEDESQDSESSLSILSTVTLLWLCLSLLNVPSFLAWLKHPNKALEMDPSFWTCLAVCFSAGILWKDNIFSKNAKRLGYISLLVSACSVLVLLFGLTSLYRINSIIAISLFVLAINQLF